MLVYRDIVLDMTGVEPRSSMSSAIMEALDNVGL